jgi:hypothetical protein
MRVLRFAHGQPDGPAIPEKDLTLGLFLFPEIARAAVGAKQDRMKELAARLYLVKEDIDVLLAGRNLVKPPQGYVFQNQNKILAELKPVEGFISKKDLAMLKKDWRGGCERAANLYEELAAVYRPFVITIINRKLPVEHMIDDEDPLRYLRVLNERMAAAHRAMEQDTPTWISQTMDVVIARIASDTGFRNTTFQKLDVGELKECSEGWRLRVPREKFKNGGDGPYFDLGSGKFRDFDRVLTDENGVGDIIEAYLSTARPKLRGAPHSQALFMARSGPNSKASHWPRLHPDQFSARLVDMTALHLQGVVEGAVPFSTHQCRALLCAGTLKRFYPTHGPAWAVQFAADVICDSADVANYYYWRWSGQQREKELRSASTQAA